MSYCARCGYSQYHCNEDSRKLDTILERLDALTDAFENPTNGIHLKCAEMYDAENKAKHEWKKRAEAAELERDALAAELERRDELGEQARQSATVAKHSTVECRKRIGNTIFVADLLATADLKGKLYAHGESVAWMEREMADWVLRHGVDHPHAMRTLRNVAGLTVKQFAELIDLDAALVEDWENGRASANRTVHATLAALACEALGRPDRVTDYLKSLQPLSDERREVYVGLRISEEE